VGDSERVVGSGVCVGGSGRAVGVGTLNAGIFSQGRLSFTSSTPPACRATQPSAPRAVSTFSQLQRSDWPTTVNASPRDRRATAANCVCGPERILSVSLATMACGVGVGVSLGLGVATVGVTDGAMTAVGDSSAVSVGAGVALRVGAIVAVGGEVVEEGGKVVGCVVAIGVGTVGAGPRPHAAKTSNMVSSRTVSSVFRKDRDFITAPRFHDRMIISQTAKRGMIPISDT
jgi:hypothetical protein